MQSRNAHRQIFPSVERIESWNGSGDEIILTPEAVLQNGNNGAVRVIFTAFNQLDQLLIPLKTTSGRFLNNHETSTKPRRFINSRVIAASLGRGRHIELPQPVQITFKHLNDVDPARVRPECVYWDYVSNAWSDQGCHAVMSNVTHTQCSCNHLTNFALLMSHSTPVNPEGQEGLTRMAPSKSPPSKTTLTAHVSTIVLSVAALIVVVVVIIFAAIAWRKFKIAHQCRSALQNSGLPCFHKGKGEIANDKDKGNNKGNFYTVTPKLNPNGVNSGSVVNDQEDVVEARQFFEHMINLQKNEQNNTRTMRRSNENNLEGANGVQPVEGKPNNLEQQKKLEVIYPKRNNYARALSPYNHIYMEIEPQDDGVQPSHQPQNIPIYEPLTHSETYLMSTMSDLSEDNYNYINGLNSDVSRQSSSRETRPLIRSISNEPRANLLQTISGVLHSQSVRIAPSGNNASMTLHPIRRNVSAAAAAATHATLARMNELGHNSTTVQVASVNGNEFVRLNLDPDQANSATYIASTTSDLGPPPPPPPNGGMTSGHTAPGVPGQPAALMTSAYLQQQFLQRANMLPTIQNAHTVVKTAQMTPQVPQYASEI